MPGVTEGSAAAADGSWALVSAGGQLRVRTKAVCAVLRPSAGHGPRVKPGMRGAEC